jgi:DNA-binding transcriptional regulator PaaX
MAREPKTSTAAGNAPSPAPTSAAAPNKIGVVLGLLRRDDGATLAELVAATGWLPHSTRAALTGLRKKGHVLEKSKRGDITCYRIVDAG